MSEEENLEEKANEAINKSEVIGISNEKPINDAINETIRKLLKDLVAIENFENVMEDLGQMLVMELSSPLFLGIDVTMDQEARESLKANVASYCNRAKEKYLKNRDDDRRIVKSLVPIKKHLRDIIDVALGNISEEINRGAIIEASVVNADCKNSNYNKIELHYSKFGCRVAVPTRGCFISTNCIQMVKDIIHEEVEGYK